MKVQSVILLRRKYISYLFELADKYFPNSENLNSAIDEFKELTKKDLDLNKAQQRLLGLKGDLHEDISLLESMAKYNAKSMKETSQLKQNLSKKLNLIVKDYESNYREMNDLYQGLVIHNSSIMMSKLKEDELFNKMQNAIQKTDEEFLSFCESFKQEEISRHEDIQIKSQQILTFLDDLNNNINEYNHSSTELKLNHLNMAMKMRVKNSKLQIINFCSHIEKLTTEYIKIYPETLKFRVNEINSFLINFNLSSDKQNEDLDDNVIVQTEQLITNIKNIHLNLQTLLTLQLNCNKMTTYFIDVKTSNEKSLTILHEEKEKILKAAIPFETLTIKAARQWLELYDKGWFFNTKQYIINHPLSTTHMNMSLLD